MFGVAVVVNNPRATGTSQTSTYEPMALPESGIGVRLLFKYELCKPVTKEAVHIVSNGNEFCVHFMHLDVA
jgi:hypothetical protein